MNWLPRMARLRMRLRKRTLLMILLVLIGGAILNVAVAWGLIVEYGNLLAYQDSPDATTANDMRMWESFSPIWFSRRFVERYRGGTTVGCEYVWLSAEPGRSDDLRDVGNRADYEWGFFLSGGWPTRSMFGAHFRRDFNLGVKPAYERTAFWMVTTPPFGNHHYGLDFP